MLFLSRLHPKKGLDLLIKSWADVAPAHPDAHLVLAGSGTAEMEAEVKSLVLDRGVAASVSFTGLLAGAMKWSALKAAEAFVLPSHSEGLSMALLEAMGVGLPVIATRACNMPELTAADAGWEIEPSVHALTEALGALLAQDLAAYAAKGQKGSRLIASRYTRAQVTRQTAAMYNAVLRGEIPQQDMIATPGGAR